MLYRKTIVFLLINQIRILQALSNTDANIVEIAFDDMNYDEESENEMIQSADLEDLKPLAEDEGRYKPLHSHVKYYNERNVENRKQYSNVFLYFQLHTKESFNLEQKGKPFIAGFKRELDKYFFEITKNATIIYTTSTNIIPDKSVKGVKVRREGIENHATTLDEEMDFFQMNKDRNIIASEAETTEYFVLVTYATRIQYYIYEYGQETISDDTKNISDQPLISGGSSTLADTESPDEELYDYEKFKMEYEQQLERDVKHGKALNYTEKEKSEDTPKEAIKRIMTWKQPKNCTKEELRQIGIKAIECLIYNYQHTKDIATVKKILSKTWLVLRVWLLIYICLAIPCWCQRGWCCCCFRCKFCFPQKRILFAKQYYTKNPPGTFVKDLKKEDRKEPIKYEVTEYEYDAYERFEAATKNV